MNTIVVRSVKVGKRTCIVRVAFPVSFLLGDRQTEKNFVVKFTQSMMKPPRR